MAHRNRNVAHEFYYFGVDEGRSGWYSGCNIRYVENTALSYNTAVAKVVPRRGVKRKDVQTNRPSTGLTLVSFDSMSSTTASHISLLSSASPFDVVAVPMERDRRDFTPEDLRDGFLMDLSWYADHLRRADDRRSFVRLMESRSRILNEASEEWAKPLRDRRFRRFEKIDVEKAAEEMKSAERKRAAKRAAETRAIFAKFLKNKESGKAYCDFVRTLFDSGYESPDFPFDAAQKACLRLKLEKGMAYVWTDGDKIRTSLGVSVSVDEAKVLMKAWAMGKDMRTMKVGWYSILSYTGDVIKIGCHKIPRKNMLALYEVVMGKPFPKGKQAGGQG